MCLKERVCGERGLKQSLERVGFIKGLNALFSFNSKKVEAHSKGFNKVHLGRVGLLEKSAERESDLPGHTSRQ